MKYYIAYPCSIENIAKELEHDLGLSLEISKFNNQVAIIHSELTLQELQEEIFSYELIVINNELKDWGINE